MNRIIQEQLEKLLQEDWDDGYEKYSLIGQSGNAFSILGYTARCMKECGLKDEVKEMQEKATSSDYNNLISVCNEYVQRCNDIACNGLDESCDEDGLQESMHEIDRKGFASLNKEGDSHYYILIDGNYETEFYADTEEEAKEKFKLWQDSRLEEHLISERDWDEATDNIMNDYYDGELTSQERDKKLKVVDKLLDESSNSDEWKKLSDSEQAAVDLAKQYIDAGESLEDAVRYACMDISEANNSPEYEDTDFYQDEPNKQKVLNFLKTYR